MMHEMALQPSGRWSRAGGSFCLLNRSVQSAVDQSARLPWPPTTCRAPSDSAACRVSAPAWRRRVIIHLAFDAGTGYLRLVSQPAERHWSWWGRVIFYVAMSARFTSVHSPRDTKPASVPRGLQIRRALLPSGRPRRPRLSFAGLCGAYECDHNKSRASPKADAAMAILLPGGPTPNSYAARLLRSMQRYRLHLGF